MSRYKVSRYVGLTPLVYDVTGSGNQVIARMWSSNEDEVAHLARFIEAHDEIVTVLRDAAKIGSDIAAIALLPEKLQGDFDYGDVFIFFNQVGVLLERIDGKEAQ